MICAAHCAARRAAQRRTGAGSRDRARACGPPARSAVLPLYEQLLSESLYQPVRSFTSSSPSLGNVLIRKYFVSLNEKIQNVELEIS